MKILLVTNIFPPHIGGPASFIDRLAHYLALRGHAVTVVCSSDAPTDASDEKRPFRVRRVCLQVRELYEIKVRLVLAFELIRHKRVLVNGLEGYVAWICRWIRRRFILKVVGDSAWETARNRGTTSQDIDTFQTDSDSQRRHSGLVAVRDSAWRLAERVVVPSDYLRRMVVGWGVPPDRAVTILNGVEAHGSSKPVPRSVGEPLRVLFVGRLTNWKGVETILLAVPKLQGIRVTIAGDGPAYPHLVELSSQLQLGDRVNFVGRVTPEHVSALMASSHLLVLTSLYEGLSHTLLEAGASGLPAIASACGGNIEVVEHGRNGLLIPALDPEALAAAIASLEADEALRQSLSEEARRMSERFSMDRMVERYAALINEQYQ